MQVLLDTYVFLWWLIGDQVLERAAQRIIEDPQNRVFVSAASGLEISIKRSLGKLRAPGSLLQGPLGKFSASTCNLSARGAGWRTSVTAPRSVRPDSGSPSAAWKSRHPDS